MITKLSQSRSYLYLGLGLALALSISFSLILGAILLVLWGILALHQKEKISWNSSSVALPLLLFFLWGILVSVMMGSTSLRKAASVQSAFLLFFLFAYGSRWDDIKSLIWGFGIGAVIAGLWGFFQQISQINFIPLVPFECPSYASGWPSWLISSLALRNGRAVGSRSHPLTYAETLLPAFFLVAILMFILFKRRDYSIWSHLLLWVSLISITIGIILAQGRAVWLGVLVGSIPFGLVFSRRGRLFFYGGIILFIFFILFSFPNLKGRALTIFAPCQGSQSDQISRSMRFYLWEDAFRKIKETPVMGVGLRGVALKIQSQEIKDDRTWSETHNIFLQVLLERGIIGLGLYLWLLICAFRILWQLPQPWRQATLSIFIAFIIIGLTESWVNDKEISLLFWSFLGCCEFLRFQYLGAKK
ncbi:hypothetical protein BVX98_02740 [bacterium F11]|nr:hypothetical protein BVX98_02740 [bacterium F11]